jgi:hypothetical protein
MLLSLGTTRDSSDRAVEILQGSEKRPMTGGLSEMRSDLKAVEIARSPPLRSALSKAESRFRRRGAETRRLKLICVQPHLLRRLRARQFGHAAESGVPNQ